MHSPDKRVWFPYDYRCGQDLLPTKSRKLPNASKGERLEIFAVKAIGLLSIVALLPFVEASCWNKAAALHECLSKQR